MVTGIHNIQQHSLPSPTIDRYSSLDPSKRKLMPTRMLPPHKQALTVDAVMVSLLYRYSYNINT